MAEKKETGENLRERKEKADAPEESKGGRGEVRQDAVEDGVVRMQAWREVAGDVSEGGDRSGTWADKASMGERNKAALMTLWSAQLSKHARERNMRWLSSGMQGFRV